MDNYLSWRGFKWATPFTCTGMQVAAEIKLADQTVMEYLLSPVKGAFHEAGRER